MTSISTVNRLRLPSDYTGRISRTPSDTLGADTLQAPMAVLNGKNRLRSRSCASCPRWRALSSLRAEAAALYMLLTCHMTKLASLLVFVDILILLHILQPWGRRDYNPAPPEIVPFYVIVPLLELLRQRQFPVRLVKIKNHTGCLLNDRSDKQK